MNDREQCETIAKFCGWKCGEDGVWRHKEYSLARVIAPNYLECLNRMHEAEQYLSPEQQVIYSTYLTPGYDSDEDTMEIFASAGRRAKAFLKTIKKWK